MLIALLILCSSGPPAPAVFGLDILVSRDWAIENLGGQELGTHNRIVPSFRDGKPNGFKLFAIKPGSPYALLGFQSGDVVERVNGKPINGPDRALEIYQELRFAKTIIVSLRRNGKRVTLRFHLRPDKESDASVSSTP
ncbi:MAG: hypothetical protein AAFX94_18250 [Myxococcota bacterium]